MTIMKITLFEFVKMMNHRAVTKSENSIIFTVLVADVSVVKTE
jgi:hypothetical protein